MGDTPLDRGSETETNRISGRQKTARFRLEAPSSLSFPPGGTRGLVFEGILGGKSRRILGDLWD